MEIEHIQPIAKGGTETEENLWLACRECNSHKSVKTYGFDEKRDESGFLIRESKIGTDISNLAKTKLKSLAKPSAAEHRLKP